MRGDYRKSRRVEVKLKPGPRKGDTPRTDPRTRKSRDRIDKAGRAVVAGGSWPTHELVKEQDAAIKPATLGRHSDALDGARREWVNLHGPRAGWIDPLDAAEQASPTAAVDPEAAQDTAGRDEIEDAGDADESSRSQDEVAESSVGTGQSATDAQAGDGKKQVATPDVQLANARIGRLEAELKSERDAHRSTKKMLADEKEINIRLCIGMRPVVRGYKETEDVPVTTPELN